MNDFTNPLDIDSKTSKKFQQKKTNNPLRRFTHGSLADFLNKIINIIGQFLLVPIFLTHWGNQLYGEWLALSAVVGYLSLINFGLQNFVLNRLNQCYTQNNLDQYLRILHSAFWGSIVISLSAVILVTAILGFLPLESWLLFELNDHETAVKIALILMLQIVGAIPLGFISGIYRTIKEYPRGVMVVNAQCALFFFLTAGVVVSGGGPLEAALIQLAPLLGSALFVFWDLKRRHPAIRIGIKYRDVKLAISFLGPSFLFFLFTLSLIITVQGSVLLVGAMLGPSSVATFATLRTLAHLIKQLATPINHSLWPELTIWETQGRYEIIGFVHQMMTKLLLIFGFCSATFIHFTGPEILSFWTQGQINYNAKLMDALLLLVITQMFWFPSSVILGATNNHKSMGKNSLLAACSGLVLAYLLIKPFELSGVVYGLWVADFVICGWFIPKAACRLTKQNHGHFLFETLFKGLIFFLVIYFLMYWVFTQFTLNASLLQLVIFGAIVGGTGTLLGYFLWLDQKEKDKAHLIFNNLMLLIPFKVKGKVSS